MLRANGGKKEAGIFRNTETGDYAVSVGDETSVSGPAKGSWKAVLHYHPNPDNAKQFRMPAPADFMGMMRAFVSGRRSVREFLEYEIPGMGRGRTEFGISADNDQPFLRDGIPARWKFEHAAFFPRRNLHRFLERREDVRGSRVAAIQADDPRHSLNV